MNKWHNELQAYLASDRQWFRSQRVGYALRQRAKEQQAGNVDGAHFWFLVLQANGYDAALVRNESVATIARHERERWEVSGELQA